MRRFYGGSNEGDYHRERSTGKKEQDEAQHYEKKLENDVSTLLFVAFPTKKGNG